MKIAFFVSSFPTVSETFIINQIVGLLQRGHEVDIDALGSDDDLKKVHADIDRYRLINRTQYSSQIPTAWLTRLQSAASRVIRFGWRHPATTLDSLNVLRHGKAALNLSLVHRSLPTDHARREYDIIHCHFGPNGERAIALRNFGALRGPIITTFHGYDANWLPRIRGPKLYKNLFKCGDLFTVGSEFMRGRIISLGAPVGRIAKVPMGVNLARFTFSERTKAFDGQVRLLTVARLVEVKGIEYALKAVSGLKEKYPGLQYKIVGDGPLRSMLEAVAAQLGLTKIVEFMGPLSQEEILPLYETAHVFLLPSVVTESGEEEGQSIVLAEAQASGLPVIATAIGGISESIRNGESGFLVPPRNSDALVSSIGWLIDNSECWGRMGRVGRAYVEQRYNLDILNDQIVDLYREADRSYKGRY